MCKTTPCSNNATLHRSTQMLNFLKRVLIAIQKSRQAEADRRIAMMQLGSMSDRELHDIGIGRGQIRDVVYNGKTAY